MPAKRPKTKADLERAKLEADIREATAKAKVHEWNLKALKDSDDDDKATDASNLVYNFDSDVNGTSVRNCKKALAFWARRYPKCEITIVFDSPGGSVIDGLALFDFIQEIKRQGVTVNTVCLGMAASMGGILLQAGDTRRIGKHGWVLIHEVSSGAFGKASEMEDELKFVRRLQDQLVGILAERSTMTATAIKRRWKRQDWWLDSEQAVALGFADEVAA